MKYAPLQVDGNLWRGSRPESILDMPVGCCCMLDLEMVPSDLDVSFVRAVSRPLSDVCAPTKEQLDNCLGLLQGMVSQGITLVHCREGVDRTGFVVAYWRVKKQGWTLESAANEMLNLGFHFRYAFWLVEMEKLFS